MTSTRRVFLKAVASIPPLMLLPEQTTAEESVPPFRQFHTAKYVAPGDTVVAIDEQGIHTEWRVMRDLFVVGISHDGLVVLECKRKDGIPCWSGLLSTATNRHLIRMT